MNFNLEGKVALVTGASAGIGLEIAKGLAAEGCHLAICGRNPDRLDAAKATLTGLFPQLELLAVCADVHSEMDSNTLANQVLNTFKRIDILINNSGGAAFAKEFVEDLTDKDWQIALQGKLMGYIRMTNLILPGMKEQKWGRVINIVGTSGKEPSSQLVKSGLVNAALTNFAKSVATQVASSNVLVNTVNPGIIDTPRHREYLETASQVQNRPIDSVRSSLVEAIPIGRVGTSEELSNIVTFLASDCASYITGISISVDGGLSKYAF